MVDIYDHDHSIDYEDRLEKKKPYIFERDEDLISLDSPTEIRDNM